MRSSPSRSLSGALLLAASLAACADDATPTDAGALAGADAGRGPDDAGAPSDAGGGGADAASDAGVVDAGGPTATVRMRFTGVDSRPVDAEMCLPGAARECQRPRGLAYAEWTVPAETRGFVRARADGYHTAIAPFFLAPGEQYEATRPIVSRTILAEVAASGGATVSPTLGHLIVDVEGGPLESSGVAVDAPSAGGRVLVIGEGLRAVPGATASSSTAALLLLLDGTPGEHALQLTHPRRRCRIEFSAGWPDDANTGFLAPIEADAVTYTVARCDLPLCDWVEQDCAAPDDKCGVRFVPSEGGHNAAEPVCMPSMGSKGLEESCQRPTGVPGVDDCAPGFYCSYFGGLPRADPQPRHCLATCDAERPCADGFGCLSFAIQLGEVGTCVRSCDPFGSDCAAGTHCQAWGASTGPYPGIFQCSFSGPSALGEACGEGQECQAPLACNQGVCRQPCDATHACPVPGETCDLFRIAGLTDFGVCAP
jgi:hypothetical protein